MFNVETPICSPIFSVPGHVNSLVAKGDHVAVSLPFWVKGDSLAAHMDEIIGRHGFDGQTPDFFASPFFITAPS